MPFWRQMPGFWGANFGPPGPGPGGPGTPSRGVPGPPLRGGPKWGFFDPSGDPQNGPFLTPLGPPKMGSFSAPRRGVPGTPREGGPGHPPPPGSPGQGDPQERDTPRRPTPPRAYYRVLRWDPQEAHRISQVSSIQSGSSPPGRPRPDMCKVRRASLRQVRHRNSEWTATAGNGDRDQ